MPNLNLNLDPKNSILGLIFCFPGAVIYWLMFSWTKRSLIAEMKNEDNQLWHSLISVGLLLGIMLYFASK
jgi:hypothetical protein